MTTYTRMTIEENTALALATRKQITERIENDHFKRSEAKVVKTKEKTPREYPTFNGLVLDRLSLKIAYDKGILTEANYNVIKNGGMVGLESIFKNSDLMESIYNTIKHSRNTKTYRIVRDEVAFANLILEKRRQFKKDRIQFDRAINSKRLISEYPNNINEEFGSLANLSIAKENGTGAELNGLISIFKDA